MKAPALVIAAMTADLLTFALIVPLVGIGAESVPWQAAGYARYGLVIAALLKVAATIVILALLARCSGRRRELAAALGVAIGLLGMAGNLGALTR